MFTVLGAVAELERSLIAERVKAGLRKAASRRISEKQGMRVVATKVGDYVSGRFISGIWEITADEWHARKKSRLDKDRT